MVGFGKAQGGVGMTFIGIAILQTVRFERGERPSSLDAWVVILSQLVALTIDAGLIRLLWFSV
jgi:hypothetical protein